MQTRHPMILCIRKNRAGETPMEPTIAQTAAWIALLSPADPRRQLFDSGMFSVDVLTGWASDSVGDMARLMLGRTYQAPYDFAQDAAEAGLNVTYQERAVFDDGSHLSLTVRAFDMPARCRLRIV